MKKILLICSLFWAISLVSIAQNTKEEDSTKKNYAITLTPQLFYQAGMKVGFEKWDSDGKSKSWTPYIMLHSGRNFLKKGDPHTGRQEEIKGLAGELLRRWYVGKKREWFVAAGAGLGYYQVELFTKGFLPYKDNGLEYYRFTSYHLKEKITRLDGILLLGFQNLDLLGLQRREGNPVVIEGYIGPVLRQSFIESTPVERENSDWLDDIGFSGIVWRFALSIGINW